MYNEELKNKFIEVCTNESDKNRAKRLFNLCESFERDLSRDICSMEDDDLSSILIEITCTRLSSQTVDLGMFRKYFKWCIDNNVPGARAGVLKVNGTNHDKLKDAMIDSPSLLQACLDHTFPPIEECKPENICRGYYWLAFMGFAEDKLQYIKTEHVNLRQRHIRIDNKVYPIYEESIPLFRFLCTANSLLVDRFRYECIMERDSGTQILRSFKKNSGVNTESIRRLASKRIALAQRSDVKTSVLKYRGLRLSGAFYRMHMDEVNGKEINFKERLLMFDENAQNLSDRRMSRKIIEFQTDYEQWKIAFDK